MSPWESASSVPKHISSESIQHPIVTMGILCKTYIKYSQIHNSIQSDNSETSKVKLNSSQEGRGGETPYDTHQPALMSPRYSNVTTSIHELIIQNTSNNFRFIILNPTQTTSKSDPRFLPEKQRRERASNPMHRLPQRHLGNPRVECQNTYQVNQYDIPLSPRVFICKTHIRCSQIHKSIQSDKTKSQRENSIHHKMERGKQHMIRLY